MLVYSVKSESAEIDFTTISGPHLATYRWYNVRFFGSHNISLSLKIRARAVVNASEPDSPVTSEMPKMVLSSVERGWTTFAEAVGSGTGQRSEDRVGSESSEEARSLSSLVSC